MKGILSAITMNATAAGGDALTQEQFFEFLQWIYDGAGTRVNAGPERPKPPTRREP